MNKPADEPDSIELSELAARISARWKLIVSGSLAIGLLALGIAFLIPPTYSARTTFLPPQQQQSAASAALATIGTLAGLAGSSAIRSPAEQYVSFLNSETVLDRLVNQFDLIETYSVKLRVDARRELQARSRVSVGKRDGLISVEVEDGDPARAARIANAYVDELRRLTAQLAITEAQQRRVMFEAEMRSARESLTLAQRALQASGFDQAAIRAEPKAAAEAYARLKAEATATEIRLQGLREQLTESAPEVAQLRATLAALRAALGRVEQPADPASAPVDYVGRYREFKYRETLFDLLARQYELARIDEGREGTLIQVIDIASPPERKSSPKRALIALLSTVGAAVLLSALALIHHRSKLSAILPSE